MSVTRAWVGAAPSDRAQEDQRHGPVALACDRRNGREPGTSASDTAPVRDGPMGWRRNAGGVAAAGCAWAQRFCAPTRTECRVMQVWRAGTMREPRTIAPSTLARAGGAQTPLHNAELERTARLVDTSVRRQWRSCASRNLVTKMERSECAWLQAQQRQNDRRNDNVRRSSARKKRSAGSDGWTGRGPWSRQTARIPILPASCRGLSPLQNDAISKKLG